MTGANTSKFDKLREKLAGWRKTREVENFKRSFAAGQTPTTRELNELLLESVKKKNYELAALIIEAGASPDTPIPGQSLKGMIVYTPLLLQAVEDGNEPLKNLLLAKGADVNRAGNRTNETPLMIAVNSGDTPTVRQLLDAGAMIAPSVMGLAELHSYTDIVTMLKAEPQRRKDAEAAREKAFNASVLAKVDELLKKRENGGPAASHAP